MREKRIFIVTGRYWIYKALIRKLQLDIKLCTFIKDKYDIRGRIPSRLIHTCGYLEIDWGNLKELDELCIRHKVTPEYVSCCHMNEPRRDTRS